MALIRYRRHRYFIYDENNIFKYLDFLGIAIKTALKQIEYIKFCHPGFQKGKKCRFVCKLKR